ncbi:ABC transporter permease [Frateuria defendens]|uniref:ABC transporter permease n=1 Tax=Frateuria defendens TaxID=2219559 RepID=UPI001292F7AE|nr:ABC transporter permease [Frateuria defendens]
MSVQRIDAYSRASASPLGMVRSLLVNRQLLQQLVKREVIGRYRGSFLGTAWSFFNPLLMLSVYTFVFTSIMKVRWVGEGAVDKVNFAVLAFVGLAVHGFFAECLNKAPSLIISNVNFVKKVVFPLDSLVWVLLGSALFHLTISVAVLLVAQVVLAVGVPWTAVFFPLVLLPLVLQMAGVAWLLSSSGVYLRDISQVTGVLSSIMLFLSPVFYPASSLPVWVRPWMNLNPLTYIIEESRNVLVFGELPRLLPWCTSMVIGIVVIMLGYAWFQKTRKGFADVL